MAAGFIGAGVAFPLHRDASGRLALVGGVADVERSIRLILATYPGERPMRPEFGCTIADYVFAPADAGTAGRISHAVRTSLERWEPRVDVDDVTVHRDRARDGVLFIDIAYRVRNTNDPRNLVFPFYVIPEGELEGSSGAAGSPVAPPALAPSVVAPADVPWPAPAPRAASLPGDGRTVVLPRSESDGWVGRS